MLSNIDEIENIKEEVINWRRQLHQKPELSFQETATAKFVADTLSGFGNYIISFPTPTSVMARLIGNKPGKTLALRADMDALPLTELNDCEYKSQNHGVMHACGHDGHTASLLGIAKIMGKYQPQLSGELRLLFQHAEETPPGGASQMVAAGVLEGVDQIFGIHLWSTMPLGKIGITAGPMMAAPDVFSINILGKGGHGGFPHQTIDCITIGAQIVSNLQQIVSRQLNPIEPAVISVTKFISGTTNNVLPNSALLAGTVRTFNPAIRDTIPQLMERIIKGITEAHGASYQFDYVRGYAPVINDINAADLVESVVTEVLGTSWVDKMAPNMAAEDFSAFLAHVSGCFIFVGAGNEAKGIIYPHHHPQFNIDEDALVVSMKIFLGLINRLLLS